MRALRLTTIAALAALMAGPAFAQSEGRADGVDPATDNPGTRAPVETAAPNGSGQDPAFPGQTRAPQPASDVAVVRATVAEGLPRLWAMEFLPDGRMLVTAKEGTMHVVGPDGSVGDVDGVPEVDADGQGGLLDVALAPDFAETGTVFFSFSEPRGGGENGTSVARARLALEGDGGTLEDVAVIFQQTPGYRGDKHFGSRLAFAPDGTLFVAVGERSDTPIRDRAQDLSAGMGKIFRINQDGSVPEGNPFVGRADAQPEIWSFGHRNLQSAIVTEAGELWTVEHGARGGDELNRPEAGKNYGWPVITYGINYNGRPIGEGITAKEGMEQPVYFWDPVIAPSGMAEYTGDRFPEWRGGIIVGGLGSEGLVVLKIAEGRVASEARVPMQARVRDVKVGPDGFVYAVTETQTSSQIVRVEPDPGA